MNLDRSPASDPDYVKEVCHGRESPPDLNCEDIQSDSDADVATMNSSLVEVNELSRFQNVPQKKSEDQNSSEEGGLSDNGSSLSCDFMKRTELSLGDDTNDNSEYEETNFSRNGFARERTDASKEDYRHELQSALGESAIQNVTSCEGVDEGGSQVPEEDNGDDFDEDYLEKDDEKGDEDDDDLTKKLLSIQVLPRIPKIKRTLASGNNNSSESSMPQRSVLERAEITTNSSSYPKWPKSSGAQADEKPRWRPDKGKEASRASRIQRPVESSATSDRFNGNAFNRSSGSNFKQTVGFEKSRTVFAKRVPCEMLFDAVMAKENSHIAPPSVDKKTNEADQPVTDLVSCGGSPSLQLVDALPSGTDFKGTERKRHSDEKSSSCGEKHAKKFAGDFSETNHRTSASQNMGSRCNRGRQPEAHRPNEGNSQKHEALSLNSQNSLSTVTQCKLPDFQPPEKSFCSSDKSYNSDKLTSCGGIATVLQNEKSGETLTSGDDGGSTVETSSLVSDAVAVPPQLAPFLPPSASNILTASDDARFKRPSIQIVPRSRNLRRDSSLVNTKTLFPPSTDHSVMWQQSDKQLDVKLTTAETSKHHPEVEEEVPIPWGPEDGVMVEQPKPKKARTKPSLSAPSISSSQSVLDSLVEVIDMDVSASPLCDDNLLMSTDPVAGNSSIAHATTRKMVTFDCPEDTGVSHKDSSKKLKASKHDQEFEAKRDVQQHVVSQMKELLRPLYSKCKINKEEYKEIMRQAVPKICHNRKSRVAQSRIKKYADRYTSRVLKSRKHGTTNAENEKEVTDLFVAST